MEDGRLDDDLETVLRTEGSQRLDISRAISAKVKVRARDDGARGAGVHEDLLDKDARLSLSKGLIESLNEDLIAASLDEELAATLGRCEENGRTLWREEHGRMRIKEEPDGPKAERLGTLLGRADKRAMAEMDSVVVSGRDGRMRGLALEHHKRRRLRRARSAASLVGMRTLRSRSAREDTPISPLWKISSRLPPFFIAFLGMSALGAGIAERAGAEGALFDSLEPGRPLLESKFPILRNIELLNSRRGLDGSGVARLIRSAPPALLERLADTDLDALILNETSDARRAVLVEELAFFGREIPLRVLIEAFAQASFDSAPILAKLLKESAEREAIHALVKGLDRIETRAEAEDAIIAIGERAIDALIRHADQSRDRDQSALRAMGRVGGERAYRHLREKLEHEDYAISMGARQGLIFIEPEKMLDDLEDVLIALPPPARIDLILKHPSLPSARLARFIEPDTLLDNPDLRAGLLSGDLRLIDLLLRSRSSEALRKSRSNDASSSDNDAATRRVLTLLARSSAGRRALLAHPPSAERDAALFISYDEEHDLSLRAEIAAAIGSARGNGPSPGIIALLEGGDRRPLFESDEPAFRALAAELARAEGDSAALLGQLERETSPAVAAFILRSLRALGALPRKPLLHRLKRHRAARTEALIALALHGSEGLTEYEALSKELRGALSASPARERRLLALALGLSEDRDLRGGAERALGRLLRDKDANIRWAALIALHRLDARSAKKSALALKRIERDPLVFTAIEGILKSALPPSTLEEALRDDPFYDPRGFMLVSEAIQAFPIDRDALPAARSEREP